jgi:hypothetical protein
MASHNTNRYDSNSIVMWKGSTSTVPVFIESRDNSNEAPDKWRYSITFLEWGTFFAPEDNLRPMTFREFRCFRHPKTGQLRVGNNPAWAVLFAHAVWLACVLAIRGIDEPFWKAFFIGTLLIAFGGFWFFTWMQFKGYAK